MADSRSGVAIAENESVLELRLVVGELRQLVAELLLKNERLRQELEQAHHLSSLEGLLGVAYAERRA